MEVSVKKSYLLINTPEDCTECGLCHYTDKGDALMCPLVCENVISYSDGYRHERCPLKSIEINVDIEV